MSHTPHALVEELPEFAEAIAARKAADPRFARLAQDYAALNEEVVRAESGLAPMEDLALEALKKQRLALLDEIRGILVPA